MFIGISAYSAYTQTYWVKRGSDGKEYYDTAEQIAAGKTITAEVPYAYRIALPWLVGKTFPHDLAQGFRTYNVIAAAASTALLFQLLLAFGIRPGTAVISTTLYVATWIGPARFVYFYPEYVDPPYIAIATGALLLIHTIRRRFSWSLVTWLCALCFVGAFVRTEAMLFPALSFVVVNFSLAGRAEGEEGERPVPAAAIALPLLTTVAGLFLVRHIHMEPRRVIGQEGFWQLLQNKPLFILPLSFFLTFGPVIAVVVYDWRLLRDMVAKHGYLFVFLGCCFATSYLGGHENERYLIWAAPVMFLLIAMALERHERALLRSAWVFVGLLGAQALAEHIFFPIPDYSLAVTDWSYTVTFGERAWGALNRLFVIDDFAWNLFSYFGSRPFHALLLAIYVAFSSLLMLYLWRIERAHPELRPR